MFSGSVKVFDAMQSTVMYGLGGTDAALDVQAQIYYKTFTEGQQLLLIGISMKTGKIVVKRAIEQQVGTVGLMQ